MAELLLVLLTGVTALLLVGAEGPPSGTLLVGAEGPWPGALGSQHPPDTEDELQPCHEDITGEGVPLGIVRCALCKRVVMALKDIMVNPKDKAGVARVTHRVCGRLPRGAWLCRRLLHHALAAIEAALRRHRSPAHICAHLRWCPQSP